MKVIEVLWIHCEGERYAQKGSVGFAEDQAAAEQVKEKFISTLSKSEVKDYTFKFKEIPVHTVQEA